MGDSHREFTDGLQPAGEHLWTEAMADANRDLDLAKTEIAGQDREIKRLQAIVDKLPKTSDGVPVVPGMMLWDPVWIDRSFAVHSLDVYCPEARRSEWVVEGYVDVSQCFSTQAAAEAAKGKTRG